MPSCRICDKPLIWKKPYKKGDRPVEKDGSIHDCSRRKKMKISSALFVAAQLGVQIVNLLKIVIPNLYRHCAYVKNVNN